jgi:hypothetical protein
MGDINRYMYETHRWTFKDYVIAYVSSPAEQQLKDSIATRVKRFTQTVLGHEGLFTPLLEEDGPLVERFFSVETLRQELQVLQQRSIHFGHYKDEQSIEQLDIGAAVEELTKLAPGLCQCLGRLMEPSRSWRPRQDDPAMPRQLLGWMLCSRLHH